MFATIRNRIRWLALALSAGLLFLLNAPLGAVPVAFNAGSLIIPMDTGTSGQDAGMLRAYGLVYALLRNRVPVHWVINPTKPAWGSTDFTIPGGTTLRNLENSAVIGVPRDYRGGPFAIHPNNAAAARPIINAWLAADSVTVVHELVAGSLVLDVARTLIAAPRIGVLADGNQDIAFINLNAAGIPDASGAAWTVATADLLTESQVAGPTATNHADGGLFSLDPPANGSPRYCHLSSMHYNTTAITPEVVQEVRHWLQRSALTHAYMQCASTTAFENDAIAGRYLSTQGLEDSDVPPPNPANRAPADPYNQLDGPFAVDTGVVDSIRLAGGLGSFKTGVRTLINENGANLLTRIVLLTGNLDGDAGNGQVTYLGGHDYSVTTPISSNPQTNGVRLFLNSLFETGCATSVDQGPLSLVANAPALSNAPTLTFTLSYSNPGPRPAENVVLTDAVPTGTTFASSPPAEGGVHGAGVVTWNIGTVLAGASATKQFTVNVTGGDGIYANAASVAFAHLTVNRVVSNSSATEVDTAAPVVNITGGPTGASNDNSPTFTFTVSAGGTPTTPECRVINNPQQPLPPPFGACTNAGAYIQTTALVDGDHTFQVRAFDAAGNSGPVSSRNFSIDSAAPVVTITSGPSGSSNNDTPTFTFATSPGGSPSTAQCRIINILPPAFGPCSGPGSHLPAAPLGDGDYTFEVRAVDAAGNVGMTSSRSFTIDTAAPVVNITGGPSGAGNDNTPTFIFTVSAGGSPTTPACRVIENPPQPSPPAFGACTDAGSFTPSPALADGDYTFQVRAFDDAGNLGVTTSRNFMIDTTAPVVFIPGPPTNPITTADRTPTFQFSVSGGGSPTTSECRIIQLSPPVTPAFAPCSSPYTSTDMLIDGNQVLEVRATDLAGNSGSDSFAFSVDVNAPQVSIFGPPTNANVTSDTTPTFFFSVSTDGTPTLSECRVVRLTPPPSTPAFALCNSPYTAPGALADGSYILEVRATDQLAQTGNDSFAFVVDTTAPIVADVDSVAITDWTPPVAAIDVAVTKILIGFADEMSVSGAGSVLASANWLAAAAGPNLTIDTIDCSGHAGDDTALPVTAREYNAGLRTVALSVASGSGLQAGSYRLFACATITDIAGNALDGAANGDGAEAFVLDFAVIVNPRVRNPNFDSGLTNWIPSGPLPANWAAGSIDGEAQPFSGAARLSTVVGNGATWHLDQCVDLIQLDSYGLTSLARITSSVPGAPSVSASVAWMSAAACAGTVTSLSSTAVLSGDSGGAWLLLASPSQRPPPGAVSFFLSFAVAGGAASTYTVEVDRVSYHESDLIFANGFQ